LREGEGIRLEQILEPEAISGASALILIGDDAAKGGAEGGAIDVRLNEESYKTVNVVDLGVDALEIRGQGGIVRYKVGEACEGVRVRLAEVLLGTTRRAVDPSGLGPIGQL